jgi:hypothetical protein
MKAVGSCLYIQASSLYFFRPCGTGELKHQTISDLCGARGAKVTKKGNKKKEKNYTP